MTATTATRRWRSDLPDVEVGGTTLPALVLERAAGLGDKPALVDATSGRTLSYRQLAEGVERVAAGLAARGFTRGDVLALYSPNLPEYALAAYGDQRVLGFALWSRHVQILVSKADTVEERRDAYNAYLGPSTQSRAVYATHGNRRLRPGNRLRSGLGVHVSQLKP